MNLGPLGYYSAKINDIAWNAEQLEACLQNIISRMAEIDRNITKSQYGTVDDRGDRPPDGDDYNALWDTIVAAFDGLVQQAD